MQGWADFAPFRSPAFRVQFGVPLPLYEWRKSKGRIRREWWNTENEWSKPWVPTVRITPLGALTTLALQSVELIQRYLLSREAAQNQVDPLERFRIRQLHHLLGSTLSAPAGLLVLLVRCVLVRKMPY